MILRWLPIVACLLLLSACSKKSDDASSSSPAVTPAATPDTASHKTTPVAASTPEPARSPAQDYAQPYLSEEKISKFIASMKEEKNPIAFLFSVSGKSPDLTEMQAKLADYDAFAKRYGFADYNDYVSVWGRITLAETMIETEGMRKGAVDMITSSIANAEQELKKPGLNPDMRKAYEEQLTSGKKSLEDMKKTNKDSPVNNADLELVRAHKAQLEEAAKKFEKT
jgi:hypothetical protein